MSDELKDATDTACPVERLVIKYVKSYFITMLYGFTKEGNDLDFMISVIMSMTFSLVFFAIPLWIVLDAL